MKKQKQRIRKHSISQPEQVPYQTENFNSQRKQAMSLRQIKQNYSTLPINSQNILKHSKSAITKKLSEDLRRKVEIDIHAREAIEMYDRHKIERLKKIESQIQRINQENNLKIKQLTQMESTFLKKIQKQMMKDKEIQQKLLFDYQKLIKDNQKIYLTRQVKKIKEKEDWIALQQQQRSLELLAREYEQRQLQMVKDKSSEPRNKKNKAQEDDQEAKKNKGKTVKKERKRKNAEELKEIGRQFLEHAKKIQAEKLRENTKLLDVYKKSIDYLPEIKTILKRKGVDLSNPVDLSQPITRPKRKRNSPVKLTK